MKGMAQGKVLAAQVIRMGLGCALLVACRDGTSPGKVPSTVDFCSTGQAPLEWPTVDNSALLQKYWQGVDLGAAADPDITDGSALPQAAKLAVIGRGMEIYPYFDAYMLSFLVEPFVATIADEVNAGAADANEIARNLAAWAAGNLKHTQQVATFRDQVGHDPWGGTPVGSGCQAFTKKANAGEMLAKSMYTGKLTGKCEALPSLVAAVFALSGAAWDDIVILRLASHNLGLVRFGGQIYLVDNAKITVVDEASKQTLLANTYFGFASYSGTAYRNSANQSMTFMLDETAFSPEHSLLENLRLLTGTREPWTRDAAAGLGAPTGGRIDPSRVFAFNPLAKYVYQSLGVSDPVSYLLASSQAPRMRELASQLKDDSDVARWIRDHVTYGSIFEDSAWRIMTAEDVIVFRRGGWKDQALLATALLARMGYAPQMVITADNAFVAVGNGTIYEAKIWQPVPAVSGTVLLSMSSP
jgi:hypothetical protein